MTFRLEDLDPRDCRTDTMIVVQVNDSCGFTPPTRPILRISRTVLMEKKPDNHQQKVSISYPACGIPGGTRWLMWTHR